MVGLPGRSCLTYGSSGGGGKSSRSRLPSSRIHHLIFRHTLKIMLKIMIKILSINIILLTLFGLNPFHFSFFDISPPPPSPFTMAYDLNETPVRHSNNDVDSNYLASNLTQHPSSNSEMMNDYIPTSANLAPKPIDSFYSTDFSGVTNSSQAIINHLSTTFSQQNNKSISTVAMTTTPMTIEEVDSEDDQAFMSKIMIVYVIICVIGLCGNLVVILVILRFTKTESVTDIYVLNLAFADVMFITGLAFLITTMYTHHWIFGALMCKIYMATTSLNQFASSLLLVAMSFDRFLAVCHPIYAQRFRQVGKAKIICLVIWFICLILMIPILSFAKVNREMTCTVFWPEYSSFNCEIAFTLCSFAIGFSLPLLLIAAFYICVVRKLRQTATGNLASSSRRNQRESTKRRVEFLVVGIICTYTACWLPYWIHQLLLINVSTTESPYEGFYKGNLIATILSYTNSALNPILYAFLSDNFKRRCSSIFESIYSCKICQAGRLLCRRRHPRRPVTSRRASGEFEVINRADSRQTVVFNELALRLTPSPNNAMTNSTRVTASSGSNLPSESIVCDGQTTVATAAQTTSLKLPEAVVRTGSSRISSCNSSDYINQDGASTDVDTIVMPGLLSTTMNHNII